MARVRRPFPIRVWLELDLEAQPIEGTLTLEDGSPAPFVGWLGLTTALAGLRSADEQESRDAG